MASRAYRPHVSKETKDEIRRLTRRRIELRYLIDMVSLDRTILSEANGKRRAKPPEIYELDVYLEELTAEYETVNSIALSKRFGVTPNTITNLTCKRYR